jgi:hypothetical protein
MGIFMRFRVKEEPATPVPERKQGDNENSMSRVAINDSSSKPPTQRQWKKNMKTEKRRDIKTYESKKREHSSRVDSLLAQSNNHKLGLRPSQKSQNDYSPHVSASSSLLKKVAAVACGTASIGVNRSFFGSSKR